MKAVIATDGSPGAIEAATSARALLHDGVQLMLVTVVPGREDPMESAGGFEGPAFTDEEATEMAHEAAVAGQAALERTAELGGIELEGATLQLVEGDDPAHALCEFAVKVDADVLVIGSSEKSFLRRLLVGSVMNHLVHHAPCPVLVVRHAD